MAFSPWWPGKKQGKVTEDTRGFMEQDKTTRNSRAVFPWFDAKFQDAAFTPWFTFSEVLVCLRHVCCAWSTLQPSHAPPTLKLDCGTVQAWTKLAVAHKATSLVVTSGPTGFHGMFGPLISAAATLNKLKVSSSVCFSSELDKALTHCTQLQQLDLLFKDELDTAGCDDYAQNASASLDSYMRTCCQFSFLPQTLMVLNLRTDARWNMELLRSLVTLRTLSISLHWHYQPGCFPVSVEELNVFCGELMGLSICCLTFSEDLARLPLLSTLKLHNIQTRSICVFPLVCLPSLRRLKMSGRRLPRWDSTKLPSLRRRTCLPY
jgi:hypothetical protein